MCVYIYIHIRVELICNVELVSGIQQSELVIAYTYICALF